MKNKGYAKFWGASKVHYGRCASGVLKTLHEMWKLTHDVWKVCAGRDKCARSVKMSAWTVHEAWKQFTHHEFHVTNNTNHLNRYTCAYNLCQCCIMADVQVAYWKPYMKCENLRMTYEKSARGVTNVREAWKWVHELCMKRGNNLRITSFMSLIIPTTWTDTLVHITYVNVVLFLLGADFCSRSSYFISGGTQKQGDNFFCFIYKTLYERGLGLPWLSRV